MSVTLRTVWLNLATDLSDYVSFPAMSALSVDPVQPGQVQRLAGGRLRLTLRTGLGQTTQATLPFCDRTQVAWVEGHIGQVVCIRDDRGRKSYGTYLAPEIDEWPYSADYADVALKIEKITYTEVV